MSIFGIIGISALAAVLVICVGLLIAQIVCDEELACGITIIVSITVFIAGIFIGISLNTENANIWSAKFKAQKATIEQSLESDVLSGLERIELVNKASDLNGELAERKAESELWHVIYYDKNVYDGIEPIVIK